MAGLYPNDKKINIFGNDVIFPGLDSKTAKFTNGDFSDPLKKPSFIPAETINLILDNLESFIKGLGLNPNNTDKDQLLCALKNKYSTTEWILNFLFPVGCCYIQNLDDLSPLERGFPGSWELWNARADAYGLIFGTLPDFSPYTPGSNYGIGSYVLYHLTGDDYTIYQAKKVITNASQNFNPVEWEKLQSAIIIERRKIQNWADEDFEVGTIIPNGAYTDWIVSEVIVPGGKFSSFSGGNRPPFGSGTDGDLQRRLYGSLKANRLGWISGLETTGIFSASNSMLQRASSSGDVDGLMINLDSSLIIPTGPENSPRTISSRLWRRVA